MTSMLLCQALVFTLISLIFADVPSDLVTTLPGYTGKLPQRHYSGFLPSDPAESVYLHYWFVEAATNPRTAPVIVWLNGGPGCSSLDGLLTELGPIHFNGQTSDGIPVVVDNPYAWTQIANVIFLESPAGVGFSFTVNGSTVTDDEVTSQNNYGFLKSWFAAFSEFANNPLYIAGESYAGIYVPTFAQRIWEGAQFGDNKFNFKGIAVGNGCLGNYVGSCGDDIAAMEYSYTFYHGHAMISGPHWDSILAACGNWSSSECEDACDNAITDPGHFNLYNIYDPCDVASSSQRIFTKSRMKRNLRQVPLSRSRPVRTLDQCLGDLPETWMNLVDVRQALHIGPGNKTRWAICGGPMYHSTLDDARPTYKALLERGFSVLIYSGDTDAAVPHTGSERWTSELGYREVKPWRPWTLNQQVMGYVTYYEKNFTYLSVKGAGHMVPQYAPEAALTMITRFVNGGQF